MRQPAILKQLAISRFDTSVRANENVSIYKRSRNVWMTLLLASLSVAAATGLTGIVIWALSFLQLFELGRKLSTLSTMLIATTFAALIFGTHCLDRVDEIDHEIGVAEFKEKLRTLSDENGEGKVP